MPTAEAPLSSWAMLKQGEGGHGEREAPEAPTLLASSPTPVPFQHTQPGYPASLGQSKGPGAVEGGGWGQSTKGRGPRPKEGGKCPPPKKLPTEFTAQKTPLVHQLHVEVY